MIQAREPAATTRVSVVVPVYNEARVLPSLVEQVRAALAGTGYDHEIVFVDDGSTDETPEVLDGLAASDGRVRVLHLSRNFGHQAALEAGLVHATGDAIVVMDGDLQDDPAAIPRFLERWREGFDVVYAVRVKRKEGLLLRAAFAAFHRILGAVSKRALPLDAGNFGLVDARVARAIEGIADRDRYFPGLRSWVGYRQGGVEVERQGRYDGNPRVRLVGLWRLAKTAIFSFSELPLTVFYVIALLSFLVFVGVASFTLYHKLVTGLAIPGWTSTVILGGFYGSINALGIAILGEYVLRIYDQVRGRPGYVVARAVNVEPRPAEDQNGPKSSARTGSAR